MSFTREIGVRITKHSCCHFNIITMWQLNFWAPIISINIHELIHWKRKKTHTHNPTANVNAALYVFQTNKYNIILHQRIHVIRIWMEKKCQLIATTLLNSTMSTATNAIIIIDSCISVCFCDGNVQRDIWFNINCHKFMMINTLCEPEKFYSITREWILKQHVFINESHRTIVQRSNSV